MKGGAKDYKVGGGAIVGGNTLPVTPESEASRAALSFVVLILSGEFFAVEIERVREIIKVPPISWVPGVLPPVSGVINLRGSIVAVVELASLLSHTSAEPDAATRVMLVESEGLTVGLLVDSVVRVADVDPADLEPAMPTIDGSAKGFIVAQTSMDDRLVGILDVDDVITSAREAQNAA